MPRMAETVWIDRFMGFAEAVNPGDPPKLTDDLNNVRFKAGRVYGRGGMAKFNSISAASSAAIIGLHFHPRVNNAHRIVRMLPTVLEEFSSGAWNNITGTALTGTVTTRPQSTVIDDTLILTNEGEDRPRKWEVGSNSAPVAAGVAPFAKGCIAYVGFLFLFNVSDDGTFTDVPDGHRIGRFSDDWDVVWDSCEGFEITLDETPGSWLASAVVSNRMFALKSDGVVAVKFVGGAVRFRQDGVPSDVGILAPLSLKTAGNPATLGFYLGTDALIYQIDSNGVHAITEQTAPDLLLNTASFNKLQYARGLIDSEHNTYYLFYDSTNLSNQLLDAYISYNYRTREISKGRLGQQIIAAENYKATDQSAESLLLSTTTLVEVFDGTAIDDDGTAIPSGRYITTGWQHLKEEGWLHRIRLILKRSIQARIVVSVAIGLGQAFENPQTFDLSGHSIDDTYVEAIYRLGSPKLVDWVNVKVEFQHRSTAAITTLYRVGFEHHSILATSEKLERNINF